MRTTAPPRLVLASASPARLQTLQAAGITAEVLVSGVDESTVDAARAETLCATLARLKARAVADRLRDDADRNRNADRDTLVLGCDSVLAFDGEILGKPADAAEATKRWQRMRGGTGVLHTGHSLIRLDGAQPEETRDAEEVGATTVRFADVSDAEIAAYVATGEPLRVAGAFTIDGIGGPFVEGVDGDPGTVIGLSLPLLRRLFAAVGVPIHTLWQAD
jgi:septum formation protein